MVWWISAALAIIGAAIVWWVKTQSSASYNADGDMWLIFPMLTGWAFVGVGALVAAGGGIAVLIRHISLH